MTAESRVRQVECATLRYSKMLVRDVLGDP